MKAAELHRRRVLFNLEPSARTAHGFLTALQEAYGEGILNRLELFAALGTLATWLLKQAGVEE